jgi:hypothetical protein
LIGFDHTVPGGSIKTTPIRHELCLDNINCSTTNRETGRDERDKRERETERERHTHRHRERQREGERDKEKICILGLEARVVMTPAKREQQNCNSIPSLKWK